MAKAHKSAPLFGYDLKESIIKTLTNESKSLSVAQLTEKILNQQPANVKVCYVKEENLRRLRYRITDAIDSLKQTGRISSKKYKTKVIKLYYIKVWINKKHPNYGN